MAPNLWSRSVCFRSRYFELHHERPTFLQGFYTDQKNPQGLLRPLRMTGPTNGGKARHARGLKSTCSSLSRVTVSALSPMRRWLLLQRPTASPGRPGCPDNLTGYYEKGPISTRLAYNFRSHFYVGIANGSPDYQDNYGTLDGTAFSYQLTPHMRSTLTIDAQNLLHQKEYYYDMVTKVFLAPSTTTASNSTPASASSTKHLTGCEEDHLSQPAKCFRLRSAYPAPIFRTGRRKLIPVAVRCDPPRVSCTAQPLFRTPDPGPLFSRCAGGPPSAVAQRIGQVLRAECGSAFCPLFYPVGVGRVPR